MFKRNNSDGTSNFWLSYADLMAGLLFVFILLIGAIVVKSIVLKSNLDSKESSLEHSLQALLLRDEEVQKLKTLLARRTAELNATQRELLYSAEALKLKTEEIIRTSSIVKSLTGYVIAPNKAIVGKNAFAHEAGIHQDGMLKDRSTYEIIRPEDIGLKESKLILGKHSGRHAFIKRLEEIGIKIKEEDLEKAFESYSPYIEAGGHINRSFQMMFRLFQARLDRRIAKAQEELGRDIITDAEMDTIIDDIADSMPATVDFWLRVCCRIFFRF